MALVLRRLSSSLPNSTLKFNLVRQKFCRAKTEEPKYKIRMAYPRDYENVMELMVDTYFKREPSIVNLGALATRLNPTLIHLMDANIREGLTIVAENKDTNCLVGAAVNISARRDDAEQCEQLVECCEKDQQARDLVKFFAFCSRQADPWSAYCVQDVFECAHVSVHPEHQGRGIAKRLMEESWILARDLAYRLFKVDCSSRFTARIAEGFGWTCIYSIPYRRYLVNGDFVFKCIKEPHTDMKIFVDRLNYCKSYNPPWKK